MTPAAAGVHAAGSGDAGVRLVAGAEDVEAHGGGAAVVRGFDTDELAAGIGVIRVGAAPPTATTPAVTGIRTVRVIALYRPVSLKGLRLSSSSMLPTLAAVTDIRAARAGPAPRHETGRCRSWRSAT